MPEIQHIKLSDLTRKIEDHIRQSFGTHYHWIVAEISGHKFYPDPGRHYFDWVEKIEGQNVETAKVKGIAWAAGAANIRNFEEVAGQKFTNGIQVLAQVRVEFHAIHGFSLILIDIDPSFTLGNLERQRRETLLKLAELNPGFITKAGEEFITRNKQLPLRAVLQKIALIASPNSEGYNDFIHTMKNNQFGYKFQIDEYQSSVQGALAESELVNTLIRIYKAGINYDCVVIVRGGGAKTDFLVFDTYKVAQAVAKFPVPVITGIGHHKDVSITDLMAHTNTKTPTKSAELIIDHARAFEEQVLQAQKNIIIRTQQLLNSNRRQISETNVLLMNKSRASLMHHKEGLMDLNQLVINKTKEILYTTRSTLLSTQQEILNNSRSRFQNSGVELAGINQAIVNRTNKLLFDTKTNLTAVNRALENNSLRLFHNAQNNLATLKQNISAKSNSILYTRRSAFVSLVNKLTARPVLITNTRSGDLKHIAITIQSQALRYLSNKNSNLEHQKTFMKAMSPENILKKGFAMVSQNGKILKDSKSVEVGTKLTISMNDTDINTQVLSKIKKNEGK